ncbi:MAG: DegT/DnrJ/EryC1/StrS family aminotransferase [Paraclostridium sordellii]
MISEEKTILVTRSSMPKFDEYIEEIRDLWNTRWLTNMGVKHKELEKELMNYMGVDNVNLFTNGHLALESAIAALDLEGEVITTPFTFISTTNAIVRNGLTPVFCDINPDDYTIDVSKIEELITDKTCAIVPVHVYGNICDFKEIDRIAKKYNLKVIYDAAHAFGVEINGESVAKLGDASMFSFHATKVFNTIEGGAVILKDKTLKQRLDSLKNFGIIGTDTIEYIGGNSKMNEFQAAMGICNLKHLDNEIQKRKLIAEEYNKRLEGIEGIKLSNRRIDSKENYAYYPVVFDGFKLTRDEVFEKLKGHNIIARKYFYPLINSHECYKAKANCGSTPVAEKIANCIITLPLYADLSLEDVNRICDIILDN